jgi:hypothetical protein
VKNAHANCAMWEITENIRFYAVKGRITLSGGQVRISYPIVLEVGYAIPTTSARLAWTHSWWTRGGAMIVRLRSWWHLHPCAVMQQVINGKYLDARVE